MTKWRIHIDLVTASAGSRNVIISKNLYTEGGVLERLLDISRLHEKLVYDRVLPKHLQK